MSLKNSRASSGTRLVCDTAKAVYEVESVGNEQLAIAKGKKASR
jgi:hypothetical protein